MTAPKGLTSGALITKKAQHELDVTARKREAFDRKVKALIGHIPFIGRRILAAERDEAYAAGMTADAFAAQVAIREPVGRIVHPLKAEAIESAGRYAQERADKALAALSRAGDDRNLYAPYPSSRLNLDRATHQSMLGRYTFIHRITKARGTGYTRPGEPDYADRNDEGVARFIADCQEMAAIQYDEFIVKLVGKVGEVSDAVLQGSHVWSHSILTVTKPDGSLQSWKTMQIINISKLGLVFPQWPTRLMK